MFEKIYDMGSGLIIAKVPLTELKEQDINARIMKPEMMSQLTDNIKKRGQLESLPLCATEQDHIEIISGHHRIKAARAAGMKDVITIIDTSGLNRSQLAAKQIAHNAISGFDDSSALREIVKMIDDVNDMLESYVGKDILEEPMAQLDKLESPVIDFDFTSILFTFLPKQLKNLEDLLSALRKSHAEYIGVADYESCERFVETLTKYQEFANIKNIGAAVNAMVRAAEKEMEEAGFEIEEESPDTEWTYLSRVFGSQAIPEESATVINAAVKKATKEGLITSKNRWQLMEYLAADYLAG